MIACLLVACAQQEGEPSIKAIASEDFELPDFALSTDSDYHEDVTLPNGAKTFEVVVGKPHNVGNMFQKHTEYTLSVKTSMENYPADDLKVERRYTDFEWLYNRLTRTFPGRVIPPIPEKQSRNRFDKDFVEGRRLALQKFIDEVTRDETFAVTYDVQIFLTATSEGMTAARSIMGYGDNAFTAIVNKAAAVTRAVTKKEAIDQDAEFGDVEYNLAKYNEQMKNVISASEKVVASETASAKAFVDMAGYFTNFVVVARTFEDVDALDYFTKTSDNLKEIGNYEKLDGNAQNEGFITDLRMFAGKANSVCQVIHNRDRCMKEIEKADKAIEKAKDAVQEAKAEGKKAVKKAKEAVEKAKEKKEAKEKAAEDVLQGVKDGVIAFHKDRVELGIDALKRYSAQRVDFCEEMTNKCASLINLLGYTAEEIRDSNLRLKSYADEQAAYEAALAALEAADEESPMHEDEDSDDDDSDDSDAKPAKKGKKAVSSDSDDDSDDDSDSDSDVKPKKSAKKPAKKSKKAVSSDSDSDSDDSDSDDSDSDSDSDAKPKKSAKKPAKKAKKSKKDSDSDSDSDYAAM